ncbi:unnamed protein product, partial [Didymodactylos carnosus]
PGKMTEMAAEYCEKLFEEPIVYRPHPYTDIPYDRQADSDMQIPQVTYPEIIKLLKTR